MRIGVETFTVNKRFPLTISRGTTSQSTNIWVRVEQEGIEGWGEASPFSLTKQDTKLSWREFPASSGAEEGETHRHTDEENVTGGLFSSWSRASLISEQRQSTEVLFEVLCEVVRLLEAFNPWERQKIERLLTEAQVPSAAWASIDLALHDWIGKRVGMPLWRLWGLNRRWIVPTSATVGINSPEGARQRVRDWLPFTGGGVLKVKLGSPVGIAADREMLLAVREEAPMAQLSVDANGGWSLDDAVTMCDWLASQGVTHVEQPLAVGQEENLLILYERSPLPIFVDESCFTSRDIPTLADRVHGINIKLMKSGGLTEAMRMVHTARACGLQVMFGCYSDSTLANTAASHLSPLADYLDLDSHLNLVDDPFTGANIQHGRLIPNDLPGLGVVCHASNS